jgi:microcystin-dependent protein
MAEPFLSEIRVFSFGFAPKGWALCNGQFLPINQNQALFSLLGTTYGGNGQTTFALPNLQGRVPIKEGSGFTLGQAAGSASVTINQQTMPAHTHQLMASNVQGNAVNPNFGGTGYVFAQDTPATSIRTPSGAVPQRSTRAASPPSAAASRTRT